ncbi:hypothetical protein KCP70_06615 [Salmonella enterica subsp. enterica]|nr:hypothetical protein KCP70_06615 [Salmonella enterica subsp. enterica]
MNARRTFRSELVAESGRIRTTVKLPAYSRQAWRVKYWPTVKRLDDVYGDRNLFCSCVPIRRLPVIY